MNKKLFGKAAGDTVPVLAGYIILGAGFGILLNSLGYGAGWAFFMSFCIYAGSMQYMALSLISSGASLPVFALTALFVTVFTDQLLKGGNTFYGITGAGVSLLCLLVFGKDGFLIPAMLGITAVLLLSEGLKKEALKVG